MANSEQSVVKVSSTGKQIELRSSLKAMQKQSRNKPVLLLDISGSMWDRLENGDTKIEALRKLVFSLREKAQFEQLVFDTTPEWTDDLPDPRGGTALHLALDEANSKNARRFVLITDGYPDSQDLALSAAARLSAPLDVFYVGPDHDLRAKGFLEQLAKQCGGAYNETKLHETEQLENKVRLALNPGSEEDIKRGPIAL